jgi:hypothetical protein
LEPWSAEEMSVGVGREEKGRITRKVSDPTAACGNVNLPTTPQSFVKGWAGKYPGNLGLPRLGIPHWGGINEKRLLAICLPSARR